MRAETMLSLAAMAMTLALINATAAAEEGSWDDRFGSPGFAGYLAPNKSTFIGDTLLWGGHLYATGSFREAGGTVAEGVARWNGRRWESLGNGRTFDRAGFCLATDGTSLYVGGQMAFVDGRRVNGIARWDGTNWYALGKGVYPPPDSKTLAPGFISAMTFHQGDLYVGGSFRITNITSGIVATNVARWDGTNWHAVGEGWLKEARVNTFLSDGSVLYAGGWYLLPGKFSPSVVSWDGSEWAAVGNMIGGVYCLMKHGGYLYAGGDDTLRLLARWNGKSWSRLDVNAVTGMGIWSLAQHDGQLVTGGMIRAQDRNGFVGIAYWNEVELITYPRGAPSPFQVGPLIDSVRDLFVVEGDLVAAGASGKIARWNGSRWADLGWGLVVDRGVTPRITTFKIGGDDVYLGGRFRGIGGIAARNIARWDGAQFHALAGGAFGTNDTVTAMEMAGPDLIVACNSTGTNDVARWDGRQWWPLGRHQLRSLAAFNGRLYGCDANGRLLHWQGDRWSETDTTVDGSITTLAATPTALLLGGNFLSVNGTPANGIASWDGATWRPLGAGLSGTVSVIRPSPDGSRLYVGGSFVAGEGLAITNLAVWDGAGWSPLGNPAQTVRALAVTRQDVYAADVGNKTGLHRWTGTDWLHLGGLPSAEALETCGDTILVGATNLAVWHTATDPATERTLSIHHTETTEAGGVTRAAFNVALSAPAAESVRVRYETADGLAVDGLDYVAASGWLEFPPGQTNVTLEVKVLADDQFEIDEQFVVYLSHPVNASLADSDARATIHDDGDLPVLTAARLPDKPSIPRMQFDTAPGLYYFLGYTTNLTEPSWRYVWSGHGDGTLKSVADSTPLDPQRIYRLTVHGK